MLKDFQALLVQMEPSLFNLGKQFTITNSPVYLEYCDNASFRPDPRDSEPLMRKGFKIFTHAKDSATREVGYLIAQGAQHPIFRELTIDLSWLFINESEHRKSYGSYAVRIFEGIFKHNTDKFSDAKILSVSTNEENTMMCYILKNNGWTQVESRSQPNMISFKKERPKK